MNEPPPSASTPPAAEPPHGHGVAYALVLVFVAALVFGGWGLWRMLVPLQGDPRAQLRQQGARIAELEQRVATLARSDQISRDANRDLQGTLAERDEEIAGLRADVAFYERFVGSTAQRRGLNVHELHMQRQSGQAWHFTATLTQNLNRGAVNRGGLTLSMEASRDGQMQKLAWPQLRQQAGAARAGVFVQVFPAGGGRRAAAAGRAAGARGGAAAAGERRGVEQSFTWAEATAKPGTHEMAR